MKSLHAALATGSIALSSSVIFEQEMAGILLRILGLVLLAAPLLAGDWRPALSARPHGIYTGALVVATIGQILFLAACTLAHSDVSGFAGRAAALAGFVALAVACLYARDPWALYNGVIWGLLVACAASLAAGVVSPDIAYEHDRLRGLTENANTMGVIAALLLVLCVGRPGGGKGSILIICVATATLALSASRGALLLAAAFLLLSALGGSRRARLLVALGSAFLLFAWFLQEDSELPLILRVEDSRGAGFALTGQVLHYSPTFGVGRALGVEYPIAGSYAASFVWGGAVGLIGVLLCAGALLVGSARVGWQTGSLGLALVAYAIVESWLLSLNGSVAMLLTIGWIVISFPERLSRWHTQLGERSGVPTSQS